MKIIVRFFFLAVVFFASDVYATPPAEITLSYDLAAQNLHVEITHVSRDPQEHRIRRVIVYLNNHEFKSIPLSTQTSASQVIQDINVPASEGDELRVLAICSDAGRREALMIVEPPESTEAAP